MSEKSKMTEANQFQKLPDSQLNTHRVHGIKPTGRPYFMGKFHHDRVSLKGYRREARAFVKSRSAKGNTRKFLILGRPRSGTTLLSNLLNQVADLQCDGEVLHFAVHSPRRFLNHLAAASQAQVYGAKLLSYQMFEVQKIRNPDLFLADLVSDGFELIHLRRSTFRQSMSLSIAQATGRYFIGRAGANDNSSKELELDPGKFLQQIRWNDAMLDYENKLMAHFEHCSVYYDSDLDTAESHQQTIDRICGFIGAESSPVKGTFQKTSGHVTVKNMDAIKQSLRQNNFGHLID